MKFPFEDLSTEAIEVLSGAVEEMQKLHNNFMGTEHLFYALCKVKDPEIHKIFQTFGIDPGIQKKIRKLVNVGQITSSEDNGFSPTPRMQKIFTYIQTQAEIREIKVIRPIHLLWGLLNGGDGVAVRFLKEHDVDVALLRSEVEDRLLAKTHRQELTLTQQTTIQTPTLEEYGRDLTRLARQKRLNPVVGRREEIRTVAQILLRKQKNNPVLIGEAGVGKTAIVEGLAQRLTGPKVPEPLAKARIIEVSLSSIVAGTRYRGDFEERIKKIIDEASADSNIILFIDELHTLVGTGISDGGMDAANILKPYLARGDIRCIGATTLDEYRLYIERDSALERRFQPIRVHEPTADETLEMLRGSKPMYEEHHGVNIPDEALQAAVKLSARYITERKFPDKAFDLLDQALARVRLGSFIMTLSPDRPTRSKISQAIAPGDVARVVSEWTGIPAERMTSEETDRLLHMEEILTRKVKGQARAIATVANTVRTAKAGLSDRGKPLASLIFAGPTGVGKTELAKALAEFLFGREDALMRLDMSEYSEAHTVSRLLGSPPGYVGYDDGGQLTEAVRRNAYTVLLLDEVDKAHNDVCDLLLQLLDEGRLTDNRGRVVNFCHSLIILTCNIDPGQSRNSRMGFDMGDPPSKPEDRGRDMEALDRLLQEHFRPELLNRLDACILFDPLDFPTCKLIAKKIIAQLAEQLAEEEWILTVTSELLEFVVQKGFNPSWGAREIGRVVRQEIAQPLAEIILQGEMPPGIILAELKEGRAHFRRVEQVNNEVHTE
ncbi:MAG: ATP-dependent Clp protease ATP-binding subunit [Deltaproteobacteria bacterium]|nr:ATP-dependent Clp protease ATP-binding subunit [Deltaproteobacteria bacterium]MBW2308774.1 ATP-dependent Clp protease ATP-binding subunit [Deltaproteobacteria bacterium]